ncbi:MAG: hypothetical protein U0T83_09890 [Bacteriovoracaceae bacterium]
MRIIFLTLLFLTFSKIVMAEQDRFLLGGGLIHISKTSKTYFEIGVEYEHRFDQVWGMGAQGNYIFSDPAITLLAVPTLFIHPTQSILLNLSPLFEFGADNGNHVGGRVGGRATIPLGQMAIIPSIGVDLINGGTNLIFGLGLQF